MDFEKEFKNEIYEKKQLAYGNRAKTGSGSRASYRGVKTQYDFLTREERKKLNSDVIVSNLNDIVLLKEEFDSLEMDKQKELLTHWRELYENKYIMDQMGVKGSNTYHKYIKELDIPKKARGGAKNFKGRRRGAATVKQETAPQINLQFEEPQRHTITDTIQTALSKMESVQQPINSLLQTVEGLHLEYNGIYDAEQLSKIFTKLQLITDGETCKFQLNISLSERKE
jgi:hypothetical protein